MPIKGQGQEMPEKSKTTTYILALPNGVLRDIEVHSTDAIAVAKGGKAYHPDEWATEVAKEGSEEALIAKKKWKDERSLESKVSVDRIDLEE